MTTMLVFLLWSFAPGGVLVDAFLTEARCREALASPGAAVARALGATFSDCLPVSAPRPATGERADAD